jgi:hypothetical protein
LEFSGNPTVLPEPHLLASVTWAEKPEKGFTSASSQPSQAIRIRTASFHDLMGGEWGSMGPTIRSHINILQSVCRVAWKGEERTM